MAKDPKLQETLASRLDESTGLDCPICGRETRWRKGKYGIFAGCTGFTTARCKGLIDADKARVQLAEKGIDIEMRVVSEDELTREMSGGREREPGEDDGDEDYVPKRKLTLNPGPAAETVETTPVETPMPPAPASNDPGAALWTMIRPAALNDIVRGVTKVVQEEVAKAPGRAHKVSWTVNDLPFGEVEGLVHKAAHQIQKRLKAGLKNIFLVGPAGSGKTHLAATIAKMHGKELAVVNCTQGMPEWHFVGRAVPNLQTGEQKFIPVPFQDAYEGNGRFEKGGVILCDEMDAMDANVGVVINSALANGYLTLLNRVENPQAFRHKDSWFIGAGNTYGTGANRMYVGRNQLDAATLNRFPCAFIEVDYDEDLEEALVGDKALCKRFWSMRRKMNDLNLRQVLSTRDLEALAALVRSGETFEESTKMMLAHWPEDQRRAVAA